MSGRGERKVKRAYRRRQLSILDNTFLQFLDDDGVHLSIASHVVITRFIVLAARLLQVLLDDQNSVLQLLVAEVHGIQFCLRSSQVLIFDPQ